MHSRAQRLACRAATHGGRGHTILGDASMPSRAIHIETRSARQPFHSLSRDANGTTLSTDARGLRDQLHRPMRDKRAIRVSWAQERCVIIAAMMMPNKADKNSQYTAVASVPPSS